MRSLITLGLGLGLVAVACASGPNQAVDAPPDASSAAATASAPPSATVVSSVASAPSAVTSAAPSSEPAVGAKLIELFPIAKIENLVDVTATMGTIELRVGTNQGGGMLDHWRYVPIVAGAPDMKQATEEITFADTTGLGQAELFGKRPNLMLHRISGFRSGPGEQYQALTRGGAIPNSPSGMGNGISRWSKDRLLEVRTAWPMGNDEQEMPDSLVPTFRVVLGSDKAAPTVPAKLRSELAAKGFSLTSFAIMPSGDVVVLGSTTSDALGTLRWSSDLAKPSYFELPAKGLKADQIEILGGTSAADLRLRVAAKVMTLSDAEPGWVEESTVPPSGLPDVFFGAPLIRMGVSGWYVRLEKGGPWLGFPSSIHDGPDSSAVDAEGVLWLTEEDQLYASRAPKK